MRAHWPPSSPSRILTAGFLFSRATATSSTRMLELPTRARGVGSCGGEHSVDGWLCQHRWPLLPAWSGFGTRSAEHRSLPVVLANRFCAPYVFHNSTTHVQETQAPDGFVAINHDVHDGPSRRVVLQCRRRFVVIRRHVHRRRAIAAHTGALGSGTSVLKTAELVPVLFEEYATTTFGENVFVVGSVPGLGNWDPNNAVPLGMMARSGN
ncbi:hypothetical protein EDB85DRAFT_969436 [Lactarius pseudohatsudake]|nr:hypothetical protein EDB85DRAFT_969436 [Lactarius pseudohatsudake]